MVPGFIAMSLSACAAGTGYRRPDMPLPQAFRNGGEIVSGAELVDNGDLIANAAPSPDGKWWEGFHDPVLTHIIDRTLAQNLDLAAAAARVGEARAAAARAGAALLPQGSLAASALRSHDSLQSPLGEVVHAVGGPRTYDSYAADAQSSWEVDLFGSLRRGPRLQWRKRRQPKPAGARYALRFPRKPRMP